MPVEDAAEGRSGYAADMSDTVQTLEPGSVIVSPAQIRELRALLAEVRRQHFAPPGAALTAAVELAGYVRAVIGPESAPTPGPRTGPMAAVRDR